VTEAEKFNYEKWVPPYVYEEVKSQIEQDLRRLLAKHLGKPTESRKEVSIILAGIEIVLNMWGTRLAVHMPDHTLGSSESTVCSLKFGETELDVEFAFPIEEVQE